MKKQLKDILIKIKPALEFLRRNLIFTVFMLFILIYCVLILRVNQLDSSQPTNDQVNNQLQSIQTPSIDQQTLNKIQQLQNQNIQVQGLFNQARNNPFSE